MVNQSMLSGKNRMVFRSAGSKWSDRFGLGVLTKDTPDQRITGPESFPFFAFCLLLRGEGEYVDWETQKSYPLHANTYFFRIPGVVHQIRIDLNSQWRECFLSLGYNAYPYFRAFHGIAPEKPTGKFTPDDEWLAKFSALGDELEHYPESSLLDLLPELFRLVSKAVRKTAPSNEVVELVKEACRFLCSDFRERHDIQDFCRSHGWGYENFRKKFTEIIGMSPNRYRISRRYDAARALLLQKQLTVCDIAKELGYCSPHEFSARFKQKTGMTPTEFRNSNANLLE